MARAIDADKLKEGLECHFQPTDQECDYDRQWAIGYNAGLNRALYSIAYARTIEPKQEWISVKDRLPERTVPPHDVLVYHDLNCGMFVDRAWYSYDMGKWCSVLGMKLKVTHWMPLPEPPKEGE